MLMKLIDLYSVSNTKKAFDFLFTDKNTLFFSETLTGKVLNKFKNQHLGEFLIFFSLFVVLYQSLFSPELKLASPLFAVTGLLFLDKEKVRLSKPLLWLLGFMLTGLASALFGVLRGLDPTMIFLGVMIFAQFVIYLVAGMSVSKEKTYKFITWLILPISIFGIYQFFTTKITTVLWVSELESISFRAFSILGDPNIFGMVSALGLIASLTLFFANSKKYGIFAPIFFLGVVLSFSRTSWLALLVSAFVLIFVFRKKLLLFVPLLSVAFLFEKVRERILVTFNPEFWHISSLDGRLWIMKNVLHIWKKSPLVGFGPGSYGGEIALRSASPVYFEGIQRGYVAIYYTDSSWLQVVVQTGLLGTIAFAGFFVASFMAFLDSWRLRKNFYFLGGLAAVVFLATAGITSNILEFGSVVIPCSLIIGGSLNEA